MGLRDITLPTEKISVGRASFTVRGLSFEDMTSLISRHQESLETLIDRYQTKGSDAEVLQFLVRESPALAAQVIALASDEPDQEESARKLPLPKQIDALTAIAKLTFEEAGGVKKFVEQLAGLFGGLRQIAPVGS